MTRAEFMRLVARAAEKAQRRRRRLRTVAETSLDALAEAREADPMRGIKVARLVPRCGRIKRSDGRPCQAPRLRGATRCRWHGGLRQVPEHPGNVRRLLGGVYARQAAYKMRLKMDHENWLKLDIEQQRFLQNFLSPDEFENMHLVDHGARCLLDGQENPLAWQHFLLHLRRVRKARNGF